MLNWLHHLFDPHCPKCEDDIRELDRCKSCETLQLALDQANREKHDLLNTVLSLAKPTAPIADEAYKPTDLEIKPKFTPWRVKQQELEAADRQTASLIAAKKKEMEEAQKDYTVKVDPTDAKAIDELEAELLEGAN